MPDSIYRKFIACGVGLFILVATMKSAFAIPQGDLPTRTELQALADAAWVPLPRTVDLAGIREWVRPGKSLDEVRQMVEKAFEDDPNKEEARKPLPKHPEGLSMIDLAIKQKMAEQGKPRIIKFRVRADGAKYRYDKYEPVGGEKFDNNSHYNEVQVTGGDRSRGIIDDFTYVDNGPASRTAIRYSAERKPIKRFHILALNTLSPGPAISVKMLFGKQAGIVMEFEPELISAILKDSHPTHFIRIKRPANPSKTYEWVEFLVYSRQTEQLQATLEVSNINYSKVREFKVFSPNGQIAYSEKKSEFDGHGFPHSFVAASFNANGDLVEKNSWAFTSVVLNADIPKEVFEFNPPAGYAIHDARPKVATTSWPDQQVATPLQERTFSKWLLILNITVVCGLGIYLLFTKCKNRVKHL